MKRVKVKSNNENIQDYVFQLFFGAAFAMAMKDCNFFYTILAYPLILAWITMTFMFTNILCGNLSIYFDWHFFYLLLESLTFCYFFYYRNITKNKIFKSFDVYILISTFIAFGIDLMLMPAQQPTGKWFLVYWDLLSAIIPPMVVYVEYKKWKL